MRIAVVLHLYYHDLWDEFSQQLKKFGDQPFDLYVTLIKGSDPEEAQHLMQTRIRNEYPASQVFLMENKGLDIGPFLKVIGYFITSGKEYDLILKLHTKKSLHSCGERRGEYWRKELYQPLLNNISSIIGFLGKNSHVGMIGSRRHIYNFEGANRPAIVHLSDLLNIKTASRIFVGGTMFWVRYPILRQYLSIQNIDEILDKLEEGYFTDFGTPRYTHAMERILGYMISDHEKLIAGI